MELEIEISSEEFDKYINQAVLDLAKNIGIQGFRKGKAPVDMARQRIGEEKIIMEAAEIAIQENYRKAVIENKIEPILQPEVEIIKLAKGNPFIFKAKISVLPKIDLPDYKKIVFSIKKNKISIEEKEINDSLDWVRKSRAKFYVKNEPAENKDFVEIEYWISEAENFLPPKNINPVRNNPLEADAVPLRAERISNGIKDEFILGEGHLLADFEKTLIGMKAGEEKQDNIFDIPENHHQKDVAGKKVKIKVKMVSVQKMELPELNDELAKSLGNFNSLEELKENIKQGIINEKEHDQTHKLRGEILEKIRKEIKWEMPDVLIDGEQKRMQEELKHSVLHNLKITFEEYLKQINKTEKEVMDSLREEAENRAKNFLVLTSIQEKENILATPEEIEEEANHALKHYSEQKETQNQLDLERLKIYTESAIKNEKTLKLLESFIKHN